ncbi:hypothetical protein QVN85_05375 [Oscillibacter valericigenes]|jgi:hypothetical protein|uniref:hypothetical protein n=1 Tax=Oscillibacter ruminantium TaxID=1263547 RepID=UPI001181A3A4|nr:hypothetical protein [Oscillibacter ruminantium]MDN0032327.1 hypothetical protein [Oscillibacter valericigenes]
MEKNYILGEEGSIYTTYGISCIIDGMIVDRISDMSQNQCLVSNFAALLNKIQLNPKRFRPLSIFLASQMEEVLESIGLFDILEESRSFEEVIC